MNLTRISLLVFFLFTISTHRGYGGSKRRKIPSHRIHRVNDKHWTFGVSGKGGIGIIAVGCSGGLFAQYRLKNSPISFEGGLHLQWTASLIPPYEDDFFGGVVEWSIIINRPPFSEAKWRARKSWTRKGWKGFKFVNKAFKCFYFSVRLGGGRSHPIPRHVRDDWTEKKKEEEKIRLGKKRIATYINVFAGMSFSIFKFCRISPEVGIIALFGPPLRPAELVSLKLAFGNFSS